MRSPLHDWLARPDCGAHHGEASRWAPAVDVMETTTAYLVIAELPGLTLDDFTVEASATTVSLTGRRRTKEARCDRYLRLERNEGEFRRSFSFPEPIDPGAVSARCTDGVLRLELPKATRNTPRKVAIGSPEAE